MAGHRTVIAVCGEALVDVLPDGSARAGGSPANTAVALARLGCPVTMLARLSGDQHGRLLRRFLTDSGVDLSRAVAAAERSSVATVARDAYGDATYDFDIDGTADWQWTDGELPPLPPGTVAVHSGSLALAKAPAVERFLQRERERMTVSVDPNLRPALMTSVEEASAAVARWLRLADVLKASTDDIELLHPGEDPLEVAQRWAESGPAVVVVTCGRDGAFAVVGGTVVHRPAAPTDVVDTVGAGDTFTAGLLCGLHRRGLLGSRLDALTAGDVEPALELALQAAAVTCSRAGADPPFAAELGAAW